MLVFAEASLPVCSVLRLQTRPEDPRLVHKSDTTKPGSLPSINTKAFTTSSLSSVYHPTTVKIFWHVDVHSLASKSGRPGRMKSNTRLSNSTAPAEVIPGRKEPGDPWAHTSSSLAGRSSHTVSSHIGICKAETLSGEKTSIRSFSMTKQPEW